MFRLCRVFRGSKRAGMTVRRGTGDIFGPGGAGAMAWTRVLPIGLSLVCL